jgi:uncharacterized protein YjbJ (UPF0337 family)
MTNDVTHGKWDELRGKIREWLNNPSDNQLVKGNSKREQFVVILQKRYGFSQEKATSELNTHYSKARLG